MSSVVSKIFGGGKDPGILGTGKFNAQAWNINKDAFNSPYNQGQQDLFKQNTTSGMQGNMQTAQDQQAFINALNQQMNGSAPSVAQNQLNQATDQNVAQAFSMAASNRGVNPALAARMAMTTAAGANQQAAGDAATLRAQETNNLQSQLANAMAQKRQQDVQGAIGSDNLTQQDRDAKMGYENLGVQQQTGLNQVNSSAYEGAAKRRGEFASNLGGGIASMITGSDEDNKKNKGDGGSMLEKFMAGVKSSIDRTNQGQDKAGSGGAGKGIADIMRAMSNDKAKTAKGTSSLASKIGMTSDEDKKKNIESGNGEINKFLDALGAHSYEYKDDMKDNPLGGEGEFVSPMAQELEKSKLGKSMVKDTPDGKVVDYGKGFGAILAAQAMLNDRLKKLEKKKGA